MDTALLDRALHIARQAAAEAGDLLLRGQRLGVHVENKGAVDLVTEWDRRSEALLVLRLHDAFPDHRVVAEEGGAVAGDGTGQARWLVDPLDGTTNFAHQLPIYSISLALELDGHIAVAVVRCPALGWEFYARRGGGSFLNGEIMHVSETPDLDHALTATGFPYDRRTSSDTNLHRLERVLLRCQGVRRLGSAALDCAMVAWGRIDAYWEVKIKPWDVAAGTLLVEEAGGRVSDLEGQGLDLGKGRILCTNGRLHAECVRLLAGT